MEVTHWQKDSQELERERVKVVAVIDHKSTYLQRKTQRGHEPTAYVDIIPELYKSKPFGLDF